MHWSYSRPNRQINHSWPPIQLPCPYKRISNVVTAQEPHQQQEEHIIAPLNILEVDTLEKAKEATKPWRQRRVEIPATPVFTRSGTEIKMNPNYVQASQSDVEDMYLFM